MMHASILCLALLGAELSDVQEVGPVRVTTRLAPGDPMIGDEMTLEIRVEAEADVEVLMPEFGEALERYTILDFVPSRRIEDDGGSLLAQRYTLQPYLSGPQSIPPILVEFVDHRPGQKSAPDDLDAYEILTERIDFTVQSVLPDGAADELRPPLGALRLAGDEAAAGWGGKVGAALLLVVLAAAGLVGWRHWRRRASRRNAYEIARARLDQLLARRLPTTEEEVERFFVAISGIVRRYLEDRFDLHAPDLTTEEFLELAGSADNLTRDHQTLLRGFLRLADLVKFAHTTASRGEIERSTETAVRFLEETRENAPLVDEAAAGDLEGMPVAAERHSAAHHAGASRTMERADV